MGVSPILKELSQLQNHYQALQNQIKSLPEGNLLCTRNGRHIKWYKSNGVNPIYIEKKEKALAQQLALKKYYTMQLDELSQEINLLTSYLNRYQKIKNKSSSLFASSSCYHELLHEYYNTYPYTLGTWISAKYERNPIHPEHLIHNTFSNHTVRSKSEVIIANSLFCNKIPYRYECALQFDDMILYPDFTICHPATMELFYWEHFGMMSSPSYRDNAYNKLKVYGDHGIIPSINLITTYETKKHPIDCDRVNHLIEEYFLS